MDAPAREWARERLARVALYLGLSLNSALFHRVLQNLGSAGEAFTADRFDFLAASLNLSSALRSGHLEEAVAAMEYADHQGFGILVFGDDHYPARLLEVPDPPPVLWVKGDIHPEDQWAVALVGSRGASFSGLRAGRRLAREGAEAGLTIVSGLAKGVDAQAHQGAMEAGGRTLAVLGSGLNWAYPKENRNLYEEIPKRGALISEFPPALQPAPGNFPRRNRIIAGLSLAVVVIEAGERSGALITARLALEMNREVMALPGPAGSSSFKGSNRLIKNGAALVENLAEVLGEIKPRLLEGLTSRPRRADLEDLPDESDEPSAESPPVEDTERPAKPAPKAAALKPASASRSLPDGPAGLVAARLRDGPARMDDLIRATGLTPARVAEALLELELSGWASRKPAGHYELN